MPKAAEAWEQAEAAWLPVAGELDTARTQYGDAKKNVDEALQAAKEVENQLQVKKGVTDPVQQAAAAAQAATKVLPDDKELADAAQKFVTRRRSSPKRRPHSPKLWTRRKRRSSR